MAAILSRPQCVNDLGWQYQKPASYQQPMVIGSSDNGSTATGHQVHVILWQQEATFDNKGIGFLCGLKLFALNTFCEKSYNRVLFLML